jgi:hypothetical protein
MARVAHTRHLGKRLERIEEFRNPAVSGVDVVSAM